MQPGGFSMVKNDDVEDAQKCSQGAVKISCLSSRPSEKGQVAQSHLKKSFPILPAWSMSSSPPHP